MTRYRIVPRSGSFIAQYKVLFGWQDVESIAEMTIEFSSQQKAEEAIEEWTEEENENN